MAHKAKQGKKPAKKKKFTLKMKRFFKFYTQSGNGAEAVRKAGYKAGSKGGSQTKAKKQNTESEIGSQNLRKLGIELDAYYKEQNIDIEWVMKRLVRKADLSKSEQIQLKALELIGKTSKLKMFTDKVEHTGKDRIIKIYIPDNKRGTKDDKKKNK